VHIKSLESNTSLHYSKITFKVLCNAEYGMQDDILWDESEQCGEAVSSSENERQPEGSLDKLSAKMKRQKGICM
jgi:hypothetical protein